MLSINGRSFENRPTTGVQRYANEIIKSLPEKKIITPSSNWQDGIKGHLWEQTVLPFLQEGLLWSPSNTGPITVRSQVITIHDLATVEHPEWFDKNFVLAYQSILPILARRVEHILTVSEYSRRKIIEILCIESNKVSVTPLAASEIFRRIPLDANTFQALGLPSQYFLMVGALQERKNLRRVINAWRSWYRRPCDIGLVIIGSREHVLSSIDLQENLEGVTFLGRVDDDLLPGLYSSALAFLYPSLYEGFGIPILEAMACGAPVITSSTTSMPEVAGDAAILVNPELEVSILQAMQKIIDEPSLREELSEAGLERARQFTWTKTANDTWEILNQTMRRLK